MKFLKLKRRQTYVQGNFQQITDYEAMLNCITILSKDDNGSNIAIKVLKKDDEDKDDEVGFIVPFSVSYATSIHKSQGLEYDSVKIIVSSESEEMITKNIFYTAITRAKKHLKIYWSPECQDKIIKNMKDSSLKDDLNIIKNKINL